VQHAIVCASNALQCIILKFQYFDAALSFCGALLRHVEARYHQAVWCVHVDTLCSALFCSEANLNLQVQVGGFFEIHRGYTPTGLRLSWGRGMVALSEIVVPVVCFSVIGLFHVYEFWVDSRTR
jgi:hypothetical protein